jgi:hypothetical protein
VLRNPLDRGKCSEGIGIRPWLYPGRARDVPREMVKAEASVGAKGLARDKVTRLW